MTTMIERVAKAIEGADVGYSMNLTRLVDGVHTYTLTYDDGTPPLEFGSTDDVYDHVTARRQFARARAALEELLEPSVAMQDAIDFGEMGADSGYRAGINAALNEVLA